MTTKNSKLLVVDASVAGMASESLHPDSSNSRKVLREIRHICHRVILVPDLEKEWKKHAAPFFRTWRGSMMRKGKVERNSEDYTSTLDSVIEKLGENAKRPPLKKDLHLIAAALLGDGVILTLDEKVKEAFGKIENSSIDLQKLKWFNPARDVQRTLKFLRSGK